MSDKLLLAKLLLFIHNERDQITRKEIGPQGNIANLVEDSRSVAKMELLNKLLDFIHSETEKDRGNEALV